MKRITILLLILFTYLTAATASAGYHVVYLPRVSCGGSSFVAVVQSAYLWQGHDGSHFWRLNGCGSGESFPNER